jgi:hypothetical protein
MYCLVRSLQRDVAAEELLPKKVRQAMAAGSSERVKSS